MEVIVEVEDRKLSWSAVRIFIVIRCCVLRIACSRCSVMNVKRGQHTEWSALGLGDLNLISTPIYIPKVSSSRFPSHLIFKSSQHTQVTRIIIKKSGRLTLS